MDANCSFSGRVIDIELEDTVCASNVLLTVIDSSEIDLIYFLGIGLRRSAFSTSNSFARYLNRVVYVPAEGAAVGSTLTVCPVADV